MDRQLRYVSGWNNLRKLNLHEFWLHSNNGWSIKYIARRMWLEVHIFFYLFLFKCGRWLQADWWRCRFIPDTIWLNRSLLRNFSDLRQVWKSKISSYWFLGSISMWWYTDYWTTLRWCRRWLFRRYWSNYNIIRWSWCDSIHLWFQILGRWTRWVWYKRILNTYEIITIRWYSIRCIYIWTTLRRSMQLLR